MLEPKQAVSANASPESKGTHMNGTQPPPIPTAPAKKSGLPTWAIVLIVLGIVGVVGIAVIGTLAAIAIPNFVKARNTAQMNMCVNNLRMINAAKQQWMLENKKEMTDAPTQSEVTTYLKEGQLPICPAGGTYTLNAVNKDPVCSLPNHRLPARTAFPSQ
jgi:competence protein ComGC